MNLSHYVRNAQKAITITAIAFCFYIMIFIFFPFFHFSDIDYFGQLIT